MSTDVANVFVTPGSVVSYDERWSRHRQLVVFLIVAISSAVFAVPPLIAAHQFSTLMFAAVLPPLLPMWVGVLLTRPRYWHISIIAAFIGQFGIMSSISSPLDSVLCCATSALAAILIATTLRAKQVRWHDLSTLRDTIAYLLILSLGTLVAVLPVAARLPQESWAQLHTQMPVLLFSTVMLMPSALWLVLNVRHRTPWQISRMAEFTLLLAVGITVEFLRRQAPGENASAMLLIAPMLLLLWAAVRFEPALMGLVVFAIASASIGNGAGEPGFDATPGVAVMLPYLAAIGLPLMLLSVVLKERRGVQAALRESHDRYAFATSAAAVYVWEWDLLTDRLRCDQSLRQQLGLPPTTEESLAVWESRCHSSDMQLIRRRIQAVMRGETEFFHAEFRICDSDSNIRWFNSRGRVVQWSDGRPIKLVGSVIDITEQKQTQEALREARQTLANVSRVSELAEAAAGIAHEVNQPLCAMMTNAAACQRWLAAGHAPDAPFMQEALGNIISCGERATGIIERTRDMFQNKAAGHCAHPLNDILEDTLRIAAPRITDTGVGLSTQFDGSNPQVRGDFIQLQQVFYNLIVNAIEAMSVSGYRERQLRVSCYREGPGEICIAFRDTGLGLQSTDIEQLCRPFYTTKSTGTGMGLAIVRTIIKGHGGQLRVRSNGTDGATFEVVLPIL